MEFDWKFDGIQSANFTCVFVVQRRTVWFRSALSRKNFTLLVCDSTDSFVHLTHSMYPSHLYPVHTRTVFMQCVSNIHANFIAQKFICEWREKKKVTKSKAKQIEINKSVNKRRDVSACVWCMHTHQKLNLNWTTARSHSHMNLWSSAPPSNITIVNSP